MRNTILQQTKGDPELQGKNKQRQAQVRGEAEVADARVVDQPARHHVPAHGALQSSQHEYAREFPGEWFRQFSFG